MTKPKYYIVEASALPEVFLKVAEAKRLLSTGEASTVNEATRMWEALKAKRQRENRKSSRRIV